MSAMIVQLLQFVAAILPQVLSGGAASTAANIIGILQQIIPIAISTEQALVQPIQNIIAALKASGAVTTDQLDALDTMEAQLDAAFDAVAAAATAADAAPTPAAPASGT